MQLLVAFAGAEQQSASLLQVSPILRHAEQAPLGWLKQIKPEQQSAALEQLCPVFGHVPHCPPVHESPEQQSAAVAQLCPALPQVPHLPPRHESPEQQLALVVQEPPEPVHGTAQLPPTHSSPPQQSKLEPQAAPCCTQQLPPLHVAPVQHCELVVHDCPGCAHAAHVPPAQMFEQQSLASEQPEPSGKQELHLPALQLSPAQHGTFPPQSAPSPPHSAHT